MQEQKVGYFLVVMASVVIILAGIKSASVVIVPFLLSLFIAIILTPAYTYLQSKKIPSAIALLIVIGVFLVLLGLVAKLIGTSIADFSANTNMYTQKLTATYMSLASSLQTYGVDIKIEEFLGLIDTKRIMTFSTTIIQSIGSMFSNSFIVILTVVFMLLESGNFMDKIDFADGDKETVKHIDTIAKKIKEYMVLKTLISLLTGFIIWIVLIIIGTDYAFLWAVLAFLFNFIPNIGSIIAAVPAVIITLVQLGSMHALIVVLTYLGVNVVVGSIIEPKIMGKGLGLSTLVVFLSLLFWGWLLGIVGMLLSIPLTIMAKIIFDTHQKTKWISVLLGTGDNISKN